jgi:hypothetical protein
MRQVETSRTLVFDQDCHARAFFEALLCETMDLGRPENVELLFRRGQRLGGHSSPPPGGGFKTKIDSVARQHRRTVGRQITAVHLCCSLDKYRLAPDQGLISAPGSRPSEDKGRRDDGAQ